MDDSELSRLRERARNYQGVKRAIRKTKWFIDKMDQCTLEIKSDTPFYDETCVVYSVCPMTAEIHDILKKRAIIELQEEIKRLEQVASDM